MNWSKWLFPFLLTLQLLTLSLPWKWVMESSPSLSNYFRSSMPQRQPKAAEGRRGSCGASRRTTPRTVPCNQRSTGHVGPVEPTAGPFRRAGPATTPRTSSERRRMPSTITTGSMVLPTKTVIFPIPLLSLLSTLVSTQTLLFTSFLVN